MSNENTEPQALAIGGGGEVGGGGGGSSEPGRTLYGSTPDIHSAYVQGLTLEIARNKMGGVRCAQVISWYLNIMEQKRAVSGDRQWRIQEMANGEAHA